MATKDQALLAYGVLAAKYSASPQTPGADIIVDNHNGCHVMVTVWRPSGGPEPEIQDEIQVGEGQIVRVTTMVFAKEPKGAPRDSSKWNTDNPHIIDITGSG